MSNPMDRFSVAGRSIVITGASGAMGREAALGLGAAGANLTLTGTNEAALAERRPITVPLARAVLARLTQTELEF